MAATSPEHRDLVYQLERLVAIRLLDPLEILLGRDEALDALHQRCRARAQAWAAQLLGDDDQVAVHTAARLVAALYPSDTVFNPPAEWWQTPLGEVVARRMGHPSAESVPYSVAGAMLGMTRQGVHDLVTRGKLDRHSTGGVTVASVRARINAHGRRR